MNKRPTLRLKEPRRSRTDAVTATRSAPSPTTAPESPAASPERHPEPVPTVADAQAWLMTFPVFARDLPLEIGIHKKLALPDFRPANVSHRTLRIAMARWVKRKAYLRAIAYGTHRHDLAGNVVDTITPEHRADAVKRLGKGASS